MEREQLLAATATVSSALLLAAWILRLYNLLALRLAPQLYALHQIEFFGFIPVPVDRGTIVELGTGIALAMLPLHLYARRRVALLEKLEEQVAEFLAVYASLAASSRSTYEALHRAAVMIGPPLGVYLEKMARLYASTGSLPEAYQAAATGLPRRIRVLLRGVVTAAYAGGNPSIVLAATAAHAKEIRRLTRMTRGRLSEYNIVIALASITFAVAAGVVLALIERMTGSQLPGIGALAVDTGMLMGLYFYSMMMIVAASAVVMARIIQGHTILAPKYVALLTLISLAALLAAPILIAPP